MAENSAQRFQAATGENKEEPLIDIDASLDEVISGEDSTFRTENASISDLERVSVVERTGGNIHIQLQLLDVRHGKYEEDHTSGEATLMVFRFRFDPQKSSSRVIRATVTFEFFPSRTNGQSPVIDAIAPEGRFTVAPTKDQESTTKGTELNLSAAGVPIIGASLTAKLERAKTRDISDATIIAGSMNLGTGKNRGDYTVAAWNLQENKHRKNGVPDSAKVAILLQRKNSEPFTAKVNVKATCDLLTRLQDSFRSIPLDDPILFDPKEDGKSPRKGRIYGAKSLSSVDMCSLCEVKMAMEAPFTVSSDV